MPDIAKDLILEFTSWFENLLGSGTVLPKVFSGVNTGGNQYIVVMSDLGLESGEHLDFMRHVLHYENSIAFVFKMRMVAELCKEPPIYQEQHIFYSGAEGSYHSVQLTSKVAENWDAGSQLLHQSHTTEPECFFQDLLPQSFKPSAADARYNDIWAEVRNKVMWRTRELN